MAAKVDWKMGKGDQTLAVVERTQSMCFCSLHHHTTFSFLDGYGTPEVHNVEAAKFGMSHLAVTEHGNVSSHVRHEQAALKQGTVPIFGSELYCGNVGEGATRRKNHLTVLAEDQEGYRNLLRLVSRGYAEGFYYEPTVSGAMLREHSKGIIVLSGCSGSLLATSLVGGKNVDVADASIGRARDVAGSFKQLLGDAYYLEVQAFPELENTRNINQGLALLSEELNIPLVATLDIHYTKPDEAELQMILHNCRPGSKRTMEEQARSWGYDVPLSFQTDKEIFRRLVATGLSRLQAEQAIRNSRVIAERCSVTLPKMDNLRYPLPPDADSTPTYFRRQINAGWNYRGFSKLQESEHTRYVEQTKYEMQLIESKDFIDYFLMVADIVVFCKDVSSRPEQFKQYPEIPVGPARGSCAASIVCYLLRITEVNPMLFPTLLIERFIDPNRHDLPDIDLDFDDEYRWLVKAYAEWKYGADRVGNLGTFVNYRGKNSIDDVATAYKIPKWETDEVKKLLITRVHADARASQTIEDSIEMFPKVQAVFDKYPELYKSQRLEGNVRGLSMHPAGLVFANGPLTDICAVYTKVDPKTGEVTQVVSLDKNDAEYVNVLKMDALGLKTMAAIRISLELIGMSLSELYAQPLDQPDVIAGFTENDVAGVFQFDGRAMRDVNKGVKPVNFMEIADVNALVRPGPLHSGATAEYIDVKSGKKPAMHFHPIVDDITRHTNFQIVYQEQILQIVRYLGDFSWEEAARIRHIISKKYGESRFNEMRDKFVVGAANHDLNEADANRVFSSLATAGAYAFNAAHCISYGMLAYWTMFLKQRFPHEFYIGVLRKFPDDAPKLLRDLQKFDRSIALRSLDINRSGASWSLHDKEIYPGFTQINGIGPVSGPAIVAKRESLGQFKSIDDLLTVPNVGPKTLESIQAFIDDPDPIGLLVLGNKLEAMRAELTAGVPVTEGSNFCLPQPSHTADEIPYERTPSNVQVTWLGVIRSRNLKDFFEVHYSKTGETLNPANVKDPNLKESVVMLGEDDTEVVTVTVDRWRYQRFKETVWDIALNDDLVLVRGYKMGIQSRRAIYVTDMWIIEPDQEN